MILIGEMRDAETAQTAMQAAESGHLVLSTLHTTDAAESIGRIVEFFPPQKHQQVRSILAGVLRGVISQRLLPRLDRGRVAAVEVMVVQRPDRRPDPREPGGRDRGRDRRRRVLQDADLHAGADRARARRPRRPRGGRERRRQQARLPRRPRPRRQGAGRGGAQGGRGARAPASRPACAWFSGQSSEATRPPAGRRPALDRRGRGARRRLDLLRRHGIVGAPERDGAERERSVARADLDRASRPARPALVRPAAAALAERRPLVRHPLERARGDQQDRVELRPEHGPELGRRDRLDAVHAVDLGALGNGRGRERLRRSLEPGRRVSTPPPGTSPRRAARPTSGAPSSPTTTPTGT